MRLRLLKIFNDVQFKPNRTEIFIATLLMCCWKRRDWWRNTIGLGNKTLLSHGILHLFIYPTVFWLNLAFPSLKNTLIELLDWILSLSRKYCSFRSSLRQRNRPLDFVFGIYPNQTSKQQSKTEWCWYRTVSALIVQRSQDDEIKCNQETHGCFRV